MDTKEIQRLLDYIAKSPLAEVSIETEGLKVSVKKHSSAAPVVQMAAAPTPAPIAYSEEAYAPYGTKHIKYRSFIYRKIAYDRNILPGSRTR